MRRTASSIPRIPAIDGLRGLAVMSVLVTHSFFAATSERVQSIDNFGNLVARLVGPFGVDLFFVVSGFLITAILDHTRDSDHPYRTFYARRVLRIVPLYYGFLFIMPIVFGALGPIFVGTSESRLWDWFFMTNIALTQHTPDEIGRIFSSFWSLAIEEQFYVLWPLVILKVPRKYLVRLCMSLVGFSFLSRAVLTYLGYSHYGWLLMPTRFDGLATGALVALMFQQNPDLLKRWAPTVFRIAALLTLALVAIMIASFWNIHATLPGMLGTAYTGRKLEIVFEPLLAAITFGAALGMIAVRSSESGVRWLESRALASISRYSYGMYTMHVIVIVLLMWLVLPARNPVMGFDLPYQVLFTGVVIGVCYVAGFLTWHLYERRFLKLAPPYVYSGIRDRRAAPAGTEWTSVDSTPVIPAP